MKRERLAGKIVYTYEDRKVVISVCEGVFLINESEGHSEITNEFKYRLANMRYDHHLMLANRCMDTLRTPKDKIDGLDATMRDRDVWRIQKDVCVLCGMD